MQVKVNKQEWDKLSESDRARIGQVVGGYFKGAELVPDAAAPGSATLGGLGGDAICTAACNLAQAAAESACQSITDPLGKSVCLLAAKAAGDLCRSNC